MGPAALPIASDRLSDRFPADWTSADMWYVIQELKGISKRFAMHLVKLKAVLLVVSSFGIRMYVRPVGLAYVTYTEVKREFASELVPKPPSTKRYVKFLWPIKIG